MIDPLNEKMKVLHHLVCIIRSYNGKAEEAQAHPRACLPGSGCASTLPDSVASALRSPAPSAQRIGTVSGFSAPGPRTTWRKEFRVGTGAYGGGGGGGGGGDGGGAE
jgi:hypothetical protein